jgi:hypothetical protein
MNLTIKELKATSIFEISRKLVSGNESVNLIYNSVLGRYKLKTMTALGGKAPENF